MTKTCSICRVEKPETDFWLNQKRGYRVAACNDCRRSKARSYQQAHKKERAAYGKVWRDTNPEKAKANENSFREKNPGYYREKTKIWYSNPINKVRQLAKQRGRDRVLKDRVFAAYGGYICRCCGEREYHFLSIDHINNDGAAHRKEIGEKRGGRKFYNWLIKNGFPNGFQVLCMNCNWGKARNGGVCPHLSSGRSETMAQASTNEAIALGSAGHPFPCYAGVDEDIVRTVQ